MAYRGLAMTNAAQAAAVLMGRGLGVTPSPWSLAWRIPVLLLAITVLALVRVNLSSAFPLYDDPLRTLAGAAIVFLMMLFLPWLRWRR